MHALYCQACSRAKLVNAHVCRTSTFAAPKAFHDHFPHSTLSKKLNENLHGVMFCTLVQALSKLQDRLPSFPTDVALTVMEEELKRPVSEVYSELSPEPVAAASLGQVTSSDI